MAATRGPAHRPLELFDGRVWPPPQLFDGRRRARLSEASHYCRPTQSSRAKAPCPEYACGPPAPRYPPGRPPALRSRPGGRREGPPGKEDYAPHNAPRQKPLTSGTGRAYSGCFPGHRDILFRVDYFPDEARPRRKGKMYSNGTLSHGLPLTRTRNPDGTGTCLVSASALGLSTQRLQVPCCLRRTFGCEHGLQRPLKERWSSCRPGFKQGSAACYKNPPTPSTL